MDDGHKNNYKLLDTIKKYEIFVTIFLCSEIINTNRHFWWTHKIFGANLSFLKRMTEAERRTFYKKHDFDFLADYGDENRQALNTMEIQDMNSSGFVDFQSHTMSHVLLDKCDDVMVNEEIINSKINLSNRYGFSIYALAYPNGKLFR